jgi:AraC-like DNA-binding protein
MSLDSIQENASSAATAHCHELIERVSDELTIGVMNFDVGNGEIKFHFSLSGNALYSVPGARPLEVGDLSAIIAFHGCGIKKVSHIDGRAKTTAATISCTPSLLISRLGIAPASLPKPIAEFIETGQSGFFCDKGRMTPSMATAVRSLATVSFSSTTRRAYFEARAIELICEICHEVGIFTSERIPVIGTEAMRRVEQARSIIEERFHENLSVAGIARSVGTNESKLSQMFRQAYDMTIFDYVRSIRMNKARTLLQTTEMPITSIAAAVGYEYHCNFAIAFKRHFGISPGLARRC